MRQCAWWIMAALFAVLVGCVHRPVVDRSKSAQFMGCYNLVLSSYDLGPEQFFPRPPREIRLTSEPAKEAVQGEYHAYAGWSAAPPSTRPGTWSPLSDGSIVIYWGLDMTGTKIALRKVNDHYAGQAKTFADGPVAPRSATATLEQTTCR